MKSNRIINFFSKNANVEWVFFDYFDTIVHRKIHQKNRNRIWAKIISHNFPFIDYKSLYKIRYESELNLERNKHNYSYSELCREIYYRFYYIHNFEHFISKISFEDFEKTSLETELRLENDIQFIDLETKEAIKYIKEKGIKIGIISDFYLSEINIKLFLSKRKIASFFDKIYISADWNKSKSIGDLYAAVLHDLKISPSKCLMIGDNRWSDYQMAKDSNIKSLYLKNKSKIKPTNHHDLEKTLIGIAKQNKKRTNGYVNYSFSLLLFIDRLYKSLNNYGYNKVYFFAREGEFLKNLFDIFQDINKEKKIESHYLYVSRLSTYVPSLKEIQTEDFHVIFRQYKDISLSGFLLSIGFDDNDISKIANLINFDKNQIIQNFKESSIFNELKVNTVFQEIYDKIREKQKINFLKYLESHGITNKTEKIAVVDVGWKGTMQDNIFNLFESKLKIDGFYFGIIDKNSSSSINNKIHGLIFSSVPYKSKNYNIWSLDRTFLERLLHASHPSTSGYILNGTSYEPVMKKFKSESSSFDFVKDIQLNIISSFKEILCQINSKGYDINDFQDVVKIIHLKTVLNVTKTQLRLQNKLLNNQFENFGFNISYKDFSKNKFSYQNIYKKISSVNFFKALQQLLNIREQLIIARILMRRNMNFIVVGIYKALYFRLKKELK